MSRNHRKPGVVRVVCTATYHHDSPEFAGKGYFYLGTLRMFPIPDPPGVEVRSFRSKFIKDFAHSDGQKRWRFSCECGLDPQVRMSRLIAELRKRAGAAPPGTTRLQLDIVTL